MIELIAPIVIFWTIPVVPVFYGVIVETFGPPRDTLQVHRSRQTAQLGAKHQSIPVTIEEPSVGEGARRAEVRLDDVRSDLVSPS